MKWSDAEIIFHFGHQSRCDLLIGCRPNGFFPLVGIFRGLLVLDNVADHGTDAAVRRAGKVTPLEANRSGVSEVGLRHSGHDWQFWKSNKKAQQMVRLPDFVPMIRIFSK